jgi:nicotinate phosphoribosyltransferase
MVYKLVEVDGIPVEKRSVHKESHGGRKEALRLSRSTGTITDEIVHPIGKRPSTSEPARVLTMPLVRSGRTVIDLGTEGLGEARELVASGLRSLPWEGLMLSHGDPAIPTTQIPVRRPPTDTQE